MRKIVRIICSILLIAASLFGFFSAAVGIRDVLNIRDYMNSDGLEAEEGLTLSRDGIAELREYEQEYIDGVAEYEAGLIEYAEGEKALAEGAQQLADGEAELAAGYEEYAAGEQELAEGQALIDSYTEEYNEGKATLEKIDPIIPYLEKYIAFRDGMVADIAGFETAQAWFTAVVRPVAINLGLEIPADVTDFPQWVNDYIADGKAQLKEYEEGLAALEEGRQELADGAVQLQQGEAELAAGYAEYNDGKAQLAEGAEQLAEGDAQLAEYEAGERELADAMYMILDAFTEMAREKSGEVLVPGLLEMLGGEFDPYQHDENGSIVMYRGNRHVDLDECERLCNVSDEYLKLTTSETEKELYSRAAEDLLLMIGSIFGLLAGIWGIAGCFRDRKTNGSKSGLGASVCAVIGIIIGTIFKFTDNSCPILLQNGNYEYRGDTQVVALVLLAITSIVFFVAARMTNDRKGVKETDGQI